MHRHDRDNEFTRAPAATDRPARGMNREAVGVRIPGVARQWIAALLLLAAWSCQAGAPQQQAELPPDIVAEVEASYKEKAPASVTGIVFVDDNANGKRDAGEKGLAGVGVTDGVSIVDTAADGSYTIEIKPDATIPWTPARTLSVCWPSGYWPVGNHWHRLSDIPVGKDADFPLRREKQPLPFAFSHITDNHSGGGGYLSYAKDLKLLGGLARFVVDSGDMLYANYVTGGPSIQMFRGLAENIEKADFGVPFLAVPGNHDNTDGTTNSDPSHPLFCHGVYTKFFGPVRWSFDYGDCHFVGLDWKRPSGDPKVLWEDITPQEAVDWFKKDLARVPADRRVFVFVHFPTGVDEFYKVIGRATYTFGGHNHRSVQYYYGGPSITGINLRGNGSSNIGIVTENDFAVITRCPGCKSDRAYHSKHCGIGYLTKGKLGGLIAPVLGEAITVPAEELGSKTIAAGGQGIEVKLTIDVGSAKRVGLKIGDQEIVFDGETLHAAGIPIPFKPWPEHNNQLTLYVAASSHMLILYANDLIRTHKPTFMGDTGKVTIFAEGGKATLISGSVSPLKEGCNQVLVDMGYK